MLRKQKIIFELKASSIEKNCDSRLKKDLKVYFLKWN